ncbi:MAG: hypothetical protein C4537_03990 [Acholeplasma sp.]|jgi:sporulation inhibitor KapD|nr:MAG: hypothetical protein C4537_03990 [Acholeplasma sp.]
MKRIIHSINDKTKVFYLVLEGKKIGFYLSNRLAKVFFPYLHEGVLVDFEIQEKTKKIGHEHVYQVAFFEQIISLDPFHVHYDLHRLRKEMQEVLIQDRYYLFIDFEMTMPGYKEINFKPEIIQVGYLLSKAKENALLQEGYYVAPLPQTTLSRRTKKFLSLDELKFYEEAITYQDFYHKLKKIIDQYHPKLVVWGKNDMTALDDSYQIHQVLPLTFTEDFIDLLKLHKDYFNLKDDLGLFKAYQTYYDVAIDQSHDAIDDAHVTKLVFDAFISHMV